MRQVYGCPSCARQNRIQSKRGLLKDELPVTLAGVDVSSLTCGSRKELWWLYNNTDGRPDGCQCEHAWEASVKVRCRKNSPQAVLFTQAELSVRATRLPDLNLIL